MLYLIAANALSVLTQAADNGAIKGVPIPEADVQYTHNQFADDTSVIIEAKCESIDNLFGLFRTIGKASGLHITEVGVKVVLLLERPILVEL